MLQWRPGSRSEVVWNDREGDRFVTRILDVETGSRHTLPRPIYTLSPDGRFGLSADFARIQRMRPDYGYLIDVADVLTAPLRGRSNHVGIRGIEHG